MSGNMTFEEWYEANVPAGIITGNPEIKKIVKKAFEDAKQEGIDEGYTRGMRDCDDINHGRWM